jgi:BAAT / Acyl-CoA thioester hydrolase C terminal/Acyl-CoA thioester hydrolase/BAAT N-terminal region
VIPSAPLPVPRITVRPDAPALDTPLEIRLESFPPGATVTVRTGMRDLQGRRWAARASFVVGDDGCVELASQVASGEPVELGLAFLEGLADAEAVAAAAIPVERIQGPVLLVSAGQDKGWPSRALSEIAVDRLRRAGHPYPVEHLVYEAAGHPIAPPPFGPATELASQGPGVLLASGGTPEANASARADAWLRTRQFLSQHLGG